MTSKDSVGTYVKPPATLPRRGVPPPDDVDFLEMDNEHQEAWETLYHKLHEFMHGDENWERQLENHLAAERKATSLPITETAEELKRRAAVPEQWVKQIPDDDVSIDGEAMVEMVEVRCCDKCNKREYAGGDDGSMRLYGTRISIGARCYDKLRKNKQLPRLDVPTKGEVKRARQYSRTSDPFIVNATKTMNGWSTTRR